MSPSRRGSALTTALMFGVLCLLIGLAYLIPLHQEMRYEQRHDLQSQALYLAQSADEYGRYRNAAGLAIPESPPLLVHLSNTRCFEISKDSAGTLRCRGMVLDAAGKIVAERTLVVPHGQPSITYDTGN